MALKQIQVYVILGIALLISSSLLTEKAHARVQALSFISAHEGLLISISLISQARIYENLTPIKPKKGASTRGHLMDAFLPMYPAK